MAKKPNKNYKNKKRKELNENQIKKINTIKPKKFTLKVTSKMKKKLKSTQNKLSIDKTKLKKVISHLIKEEPPILKNIKQEEENEEIEEDEIKCEGRVPLYLFITLKKDLNDVELKFN